MQYAAYDLEEAAHLMMQERLDAHSEYYLDLRTGKPVVLSKRVLHAVDADDVEVLNHLSTHLRSDVSLAADVMSNRPNDFIALPVISPSDVLSRMQQFIATVEAPEIRAALAASLQGRGAFRRFRQELMLHPAEAAQWQAFNHAQVIEQLTECLYVAGVVSH